MKNVRCFAMMRWILCFVCVGALAMWSVAEAWATPPEYTSKPNDPTNINEDVLYTDLVEVIDLQGHTPLVISLQKAPAGMSISNTVMQECFRIDMRFYCRWRATINWTPTNEDVKVNYDPKTQKGRHDITIRATDQKFNQFTDYSYQIFVQNINDPPVLKAIPNQKATEKQLWTYTLQANDIDPTNDTLEFSLKTAPPGMVIESATGKLTWTPQNEHVGTHSVTARVIDGKGGSDEKSFTIVVENVNDPPKIISTPSTGAVKDQLYTYEVVAIDPDPTGDILTYKLLQHPQGMTIEPKTGLIKWTPTAADINKSFNVSVEVDDGNGGKDTQAWKISVVGENDPPQIISTPVTQTLEDQPYIYLVEGIDRNNHAIAFSLMQAPMGMQITKKSNTSAEITWSPNNDHVGQHRVRIQADDGNGGVVYQEYILTVINVNDPPQITSKPITNSTEKQRYEYQVAAIDIDPTNDKLSFSLVQSPKGMVIDPSSGLIQWTPDNSHANKSNTVEIKVEDGKGGSDVQKYQLWVENVNDPPQITSTPVTSATQGVLYRYIVTAIDPDPTNDVLTFRLVSGPSGMKIDTGNGLLQWTPNNNDAILKNHGVTVEVSDDKGGKAAQSFIITVENVNDPPEITSTPITGAVVGQKYQYAVKAVDPDPTNDTLTYSFTRNPTGMTIDPNTGLIEWTPLLSQKGTHQVVLKVTDNHGASASQTFDIVVIDTNNTPVITSTPPLEATQDKQYIYEVKATDKDNDKLSYILEQGPAQMTLDKSTGMLMWTPLNADVGIHIVKIRVDDGRGGIALQQYNLTVINVNDDPIITSNPPLEATEKALYTYQVRAYDPDPTNDVLTYSLTNPPTGMKINASTGLVSWTPGNSEVGRHQISIEVIDGKGGKASQTYTLTVINVNDPPFFVSKPITSVKEKELYQYRAEAQDIDPTNDKLTYSLLQGPTDKGMTINADTGLILWTPQNEHVGLHTIAIRVSDGKGGSDTQTFTLTVINVNDPPKITSQPPTGATQGKLYSYTVKAIDIDPTNDILTYNLTDKPIDGPTHKMQINPATGEITWIPEQIHISKKHLVTVVVDDGKGGTDRQSWMIDVVDINDPPVFTEKPLKLEATEGQLFQYQAKASDPDNDRLLYKLLQNPTKMQINPVTGLILWTPTNDDAAKSHIIIVQVDDNRGGTAEHTISINVANVNDPPKITTSPVTQSTQDKLYTYDVDAIDIDPTNDTLTYSLVTGPTDMKINATTGLIQWTPANKDVGVHLVTVQVDDGNGGTDSQSFNLTVSNVNDPPDITSKPVTEATEGKLYLYLVKAIDIDPTNDVLTFSLETSPTGMRIDSSSGLIEWTPTNSDAEKQHPVKIKVDDGNGASDTQEYLLKVHNVNDPPEITSQPVTEVVMGELYTYLVKAIDIDPINDKLTYILLNAPKGMTIDKEAGLIQWQTSHLDVGTHAVEIRVDDDKGGQSKTQIFNLIVKAHPEAPIANAGPALFENPKQIQLDGSNSTDPKGKALTYEWSLVEGPDTGVVLQKTSDIKPTIILRRAGLYRFQLIANNGTYKSPPAFTQVTIRNVKPFAFAGWHFAAMVDTDVSLDGSRSDDSNGDRDKLSFAWTQIGGETTTIKDETSAKPSFRPTTSGIYSFELVVSDGELSSTPARVDVVVYDANKQLIPPHAVIVAPTEGKLDQEIIINGSRSRSLSDNTLEYIWSVVDGPSKPSFVPNKERATFKASKPGSYLLQLVVKDQISSSLPALHRIAIIGDKPLPMAKLEHGYAIFETMHILDGSNSTHAKGDVSFQWTQMGGPPVDLLDAKTAKPSFFVLNRGTYRFSLTISEQDGSVSAPTEVVIRVNIEGNKPPIAKPGENISGSSIRAGNVVALDGSQSSDPENKPLTFRWRQVSGIPVALQKSDTAQASFSGIAYDILGFELIVSDGETESLPGSIVYVVVNSDRNGIPIAHAGDNQKVLAGVQVTLDGSKSSDPDNDPLTFHWRQISPADTLLSLDLTDPVKPTFTIPEDTQINKFIFGLIVDDGKISSLEAMTEISVDGVNQAPTAVIEPVQAVTVGDTVKLDGSKSSDPNPDDKLSFLWKQTDGSAVSIKDPTEPKASFVAKSEGKVTIELAVSDGTLEHKASIVIEIKAKEEPPPAGCGCSQAHHKPFVPIAPIILFLLGLLALHRKN